jgi:Xaa-Pro aminopeptidase
VSGLAAIYPKRLQDLRSALGERELEAIWVEPSVGLYYLTGLEPVSIERLFGLVVPAQGEMRMVVPHLLADECRHLAEDMEQFVWDDGEGPEDALADALKGVSHVCVQGSLPFWSLEGIRRVRPDVRVEADPGVLSALREHKDEMEVDLIRRSGAVTDEVVAWVGSLDLASMTERELAGRVQAHYLELGHRPTPHALIASGPNAAMPHYPGGNVSIDVHRPLLMDFGCAVEGYWSDITRIYFPSETDADIDEAYAVVCSAYDDAFAAVGPGVTCHDVDRAARSVIEDAGYGDAFIHRTGHGLGLEVHEPPYLRAGNNQPLEVGHVFSIEPGIYRPDRFGVRYENIVYLGEDGPETMNRSPRVHRFVNSDR